MAQKPKVASIRVNASHGRRSPERSARAGKTNAEGTRTRANTASSSPARPSSSPWSAYGGAIHVSDEKNRHDSAPKNRATDQARPLRQGRRVSSCAPPGRGELRARGARGNQKTTATAARSDQAARAPGQKPPRVRSLGRV